jgi:hypothetical protein
MRPAYRNKVGIAFWLRPFRALYKRPTSFIRLINSQGLPGLDLFRLESRDVECFLFCGGKTCDEEVLLLLWISGSVCVAQELFCVETLDKVSFAFARHPRRDISHGTQVVSGLEPLEVTRDQMRGDVSIVIRSQPRGGQFC